MEQHEPEDRDDDHAGDPSGDLARGGLGHAAILAANPERICPAS
jgi:hypothetical protein